jgi:hypothetical protein
MSTHISKTILDKIEKENIKPRARWYFVVEHGVLWIPGALVTALGAVAVAGMLYAVAHSGWEYHEFIYASRVDFFVAASPFLWILSFVVFNSLIVKALRTTHLGYRLSAKKILLGSIGSSIILGSCSYIIDEKFDADSIIRYPVHIREEQIWTSPQEGRLMGRIEKKYEDSVIIRDKNNILWIIDMSGFGTTTFPFVVEGKSIRIIGTSTNESNIIGDDDSKGATFIACAVFPWEIGGPVRTQLQPFRGNPSPKMRQLQNKNPDCAILLDHMKRHSIAR